MLQSTLSPVPTPVRFHTWADARAELGGMLDDEGAVLPIGRVWRRGDRITLHIHVGAELVLILDARVRRVITTDDGPCAFVTAGDEKARADVSSFVHGLHACAAR